MTEPRSKKQRAEYISPNDVRILAQVDRVAANLKRRMFPPISVPVFPKIQAVQCDHSALEVENARLREEVDNLREEIRWLQIDLGGGLRPYPPIDYDFPQN